MCTYTANWNHCGYALPVRYNTRHDAIQALNRDDTGRQIVESPAAVELLNTLPWDDRGMLWTMDDPTAGCGVVITPAGELVDLGDR